MQKCGREFRLRVAQPDFLDVLIALGTNQVGCMMVRMMVTMMMMMMMMMMVALRTGICNINYDKNYNIE